MVETRSVQLPTGSPKMTSGLTISCRRSIEASRFGKRQQKQPPATSWAGIFAERTSAVSTRSLAWSLVTMPTRNPCAASKRAVCNSSVVFPAPRKPPTSNRRVAMKRSSLEGETLKPEKSKSKQHVDEHYCPDKRHHQPK